MFDKIVVAPRPLEAQIEKMGELETVKDDREKGNLLREFTNALRKAWTSYKRDPDDFKDSVVALTMIDGNVVAGAAMIPKNGWYEIASLFSLPEYRNRGLGNEVTNRMDAIARQLGRKTFGEAVTAHPFSQIIMENIGKEPVAYLPMAVADWPIGFGNDDETRRKVEAGELRIGFIVYMERPDINVPAGTRTHEILKALSLMGDGKSNSHEESVHFEMFGVNYVISSPEDVEKFEREGYVPLGLYPHGNGVGVILISNKDIMKAYQKAWQSLEYEEFTQKAVKVAEYVRESLGIGPGMWRRHLA